MLVPPHYLDAVAVVEFAPCDAADYDPVATATMLGYRAQNQEGVPDHEVGHHLYLVTNKHVVEGRSEIWVRFNQGASSQQYKILVEDEENEYFYVSEEFDLAATYINSDALREAGADFSFLPEGSFLDLSGLESMGVAGGDGVFVLGFPMGLAGRERKYAIVRGGCIARLDREIISTDKGFLIDATVYPGNSGGPVILKLEDQTLGDHPTRQRVHVIGIVSGYLPYTETAISAQTLQPRITFQENSGLASVVPFDAIHDLIRPLMETIGEEEETESQPEDAGLLPPSA